MSPAACVERSNAALIVAYSHRWDNELYAGASPDQVLQAIRTRHAQATPEPVVIYARQNEPCGPGYPVRSKSEPGREMAFSSRHDAVFYAQCHRDIGLLLDYLDVLQKRLTESEKIEWQEMLA